jgi:hypothetical protein
MRNRLTITKLRIAPDVVCRLNHLDLSLADLDLILSFARRTRGPDRTVYSFAPEKLPPDAARRLSHLVGCAAIVIASEVVDIIKEAADCEPPSCSEACDGSATRQSAPSEASEE